MSVHPFDSIHKHIGEDLEEPGDDNAAFVTVYDVRVVVVVSCCMVVIIGTIGLLEGPGLWYDFVSCVVALFFVLLSLLVSIPV